MTDRDALLRAIAANPDDDTPRLIYADLLDEIGGDTNTARARFIRLQIETHRDPYDPYDFDEDSYYSGSAQDLDEVAERVLAQKRGEVAALANRYHGVWLAELPTWCNPMFGLLGRTRADLFVRGFVERVTARTKSFAFRAPELFDTTPVRELELHGGSAKLLAPTFDNFEFVRLKALTVDWPGAPGELADALAECPWLSELTALDLSGCGLDASSVRALSRAQGLRALRAIRLGGSLDVASVRALAASPKLPGLREINLIACRPPFESHALRNEFPNLVFYGGYE